MLENLDFFRVRKQFSFLFTSRCPNISVVACRGGGKTVAAVQSTVHLLLAGPPNESAIFFSSTLGQAKNTVEGPMRAIMSKYPNEFCRYNSSEHKYKFFVGSGDVRELILLSYEEQETKRGYHPSIIVLDECASIPKNMFSLIILPMLAPARSAGRGRLLCIGTAQGRNTFFELWNRGLDPNFPDWESYMLKASDSNLLDQEYLREMRMNMTQAEYAQEFECDFDANVLVGSVYGEFLDRAAHNIDDSFGYDPNWPVWTAWDLGWADYVSIWFFQTKNDQITFIDFFEDSEHDTSYYANILHKRGYNYRGCLLPFDGANHHMSGPPIRDQLEKFGLPALILPRSSEEYGLDEARRLLKVARFAKSACAVGLEHLRSFRYKIDRKTGRKLAMTDHDKHSHAADAFRYAAVGRSFWEEGAGYVKKKFLKPYDVWSCRRAKIYS